MNRFQGISCFISKELLLMENTNFSNQRSYRSVHLYEKKNEQNEHISVKLQIPRKLKKYQILGNFQKRAFYCLVYVMNRFQVISCLVSKEPLLVKNCNFFNQMLYRSVLLHENFQYFGSNHDISRLCEQLSFK